jgi:hypothetical protein
VQSEIVAYLPVLGSSVNCSSLLILPIAFGRSVC